MSASSPDSPAYRRRRVVFQTRRVVFQTRRVVFQTCRLLSIAGAATAVALVAIASFFHVPEGHQAFVRVRGSSSLRLVGPGWHLRLPVLHEVEILPGEAGAAGATPAGSIAAVANAPPLDHPIVVVGLDGADWQTAEPLMLEGRLPVLARLRKAGARGHLRSSVPMLSPLLWTTAATGKPPDQHGVVDFLVNDPATGKKIPISSRSRRVKALWNIFTDQGRTADVIAWWATFPAEAIRGSIVSDRVAYSLFDVSTGPAGGTGLVHPGSIWSGVRSRIVPVETIADGEIESLARVTPDEIAKAKRAAGAGGPGASKDRLVHLIKILAGTRTYHSIALDLLELGQPDLFMLYYQGIDEVSHRFAHCAAPALPLCGPADAARYSGTVAAFYELQDRLLGEILGKIDPGSYIVVLSDHGFRNGGDRPRDIAPDIEGKPAKWHRPYGIALVSGPGIQPRDLENVTLFDVAPTVLRLAGLPGASDMAGRALVEPPDLPSPPSVATYENAGGSGGTQVASASSSEVDQGMLDNLRSLGYIGGGEETPETITAHTNVGTIALQKGDTTTAEREFLAALGQAADYFPALMGLAEVRIRQDRLDDALQLTRRAMEHTADPEPGVYLRYAALAQKRGAAEEAARALRRLRSVRPQLAEIPVALAIPLMEAGRSEEAEALLRQALTIDPASTEAMSRLFQIQRREGREAELEPALREALGMNPASVLHRNWLGLILERRGDLAGAEKEFRTALATAPDFGGTMANLGSLYGRQGRLDEAVAILTKALRVEPGNLECRVNLGAALGKLGRAEEAARVLEEGRDPKDPSPELLNALAITYGQRGDTRKAMELLRESLAINPDQPRAKAMLQEMQGG